MRAGLAAHESIVSKDGVWIGKSWLRVARDTDEKAGVLEREREISELSTQTRAQAANIEALKQLITTAREDLVAAEAGREQLQGEYNQVQRAVSDLRAQLAAVQSRLEQQQSRREHVMMETEVLRTEKAGEAEQQEGARTRLQEALEAAAPPCHWSARSAHASSNISAVCLMPPGRRRAMISRRCMSWRYVLSPCIRRRMPPTSHWRACVSSVSNCLYVAMN
jgi:chromosome segregation ATPase